MSVATYEAISMAEPLHSRTNMKMELPLILTMLMALRSRTITHLGTFGRMQLE
jgi:hypothetical protein